MKTSHLLDHHARKTIGLAAIAVLGACGSSSDPSPSLDQSSALTADSRGIAIVSSETSWPSDPISIDSARVEGDSLVANVSHGGGCARHTYQLVVGTAWMESFPVQAPGRLSHDAHGDTCKALLRRELRISLAPLAAAYHTSYGQEHGTVALLLAGHTGLLWYKF